VPLGHRLRGGDVQGRRSALLMNGAATPAGTHEVELGTRGWRAGCYFVRITTGGTTTTNKLLVLD
jgi:hypothetical protein